MTLAERIQAVAEVTTGRAMSAMAAGMIAAQLEERPEAEVIAALDQCMREGVRWLTLAEVTRRLPGAHLGAAEAWAIAERAYDETDSVVWTHEIERAFGVVRHLEDRVAARLGFREAYERLVGEAGGRPTWNLSSGTDSMSRAAAVHDAIGAGRLAKGDAKRLLGVGHPPPRQRALPAPSGAGPVRISEVEAFVEELKRGIS